MFPISDSIKTRRFPILNVIIIAITLFVFVQELITPNPDSFIERYAFIPSMVNFNDVSTLFPFFTAIFLHGGFLHIISNMWFLWVFGDNVELRLGKLFFIFLYFTAGFLGNFLQYLLMTDSSIPMLGASGSIAGVLGAYYILFPHAKIKTIIPIFIFLAFFEIPASIVLGYWFVLQIISGAVSIPFSSMGGIAFFAHVGGFLSGVVFAKIIEGIRYHPREMIFGDLFKQHHPRLHH